MTANIFIAIPCHNRRRVCELCLPTMQAAMHKDDVLALYNDGSSEYDAKWLRQFSPNVGASMVADSPDPIGIQAQRRLHLRHFLGLPGATHLYFTDHDCIHDPNWRTHALRLQAEYSLPICLYDTQAHSRIPGNTLEDDPESEIIVRAAAPGVSYLLTREHVERLAPHISTLDHFDWTIPALLGGRFGISRVGYVDHIGWQGVRHPTHEGPDGGDRVKQPTPFLVAKRAEVVAALSI